MALCADTVDQPACRVGPADEGDESLDLGVVRVEVVVVDVQLRGGVCGTRGLEGDGDEGFSEDVGEDAGADASVFVEHLAIMGV